MAEPLAAMVDSPYVSRPTLEAALEASLEAGGALLVGPAGVGKSRLLAETLRDRRLLWMSCGGARLPSTRAVAAGLLVQAGANDEQLLFRLVGDGKGALESDESALLEAAGRRLRGLAGGRIVVLDDAERLQGDEAQVLSTFIEATHLPWLVASRIGMPALRLREVVVGELSEQQADAMVRGLLPAADSRIRESVLTGGSRNPLQLEQCALWVAEGGSSHAVERVIESEPKLASMHKFVARRLRLLPEPERLAVEIAAVLGEEPDQDLLRRLSGDDGIVAEALVARGFLRWRSGPVGQPVLSFAHALFREVAYDETPADRRIAVHRAAAEWYSVLPVSHVLEAQAHHLEQALVLDESDCDLVRRTVEAMVLFARSIEEERSRLSRQVLARARVLVEGRGECAPDALPLELASSSVAITSGDFAEGLAAAERALSLAETRGDRGARAEGQLLLARAITFLDGEDVASAHLDRADQLFEELGDLGGQARVAVHRGYLAQRAQGAAQAIAAFERSYGLAMRSGDARLQATCAQQLALHHAISTGREKNELWALRAQEVSRRDDVGVEPRLQLATTVLAVFDLHPAKGLDAAQQALDSGRDLALEHVYGNAVIGLADLLLLQGRLDEAVSILDEGRQVAERRSRDWLLLQFDLLEARVALRTGDVARAQSLLDHVSEHELIDNSVLRHDLAEARAWVALERGEFQQARALADEAVLLDEQMGDACTMLRPRLISLLALAAAGDALPLADIAKLRALSRDTGLTTIAELATRWIYVDELTHGWTVDLHGLSECDVIECRALDLEIEALSTRSFDRLVDAAAVWAELGTTVWQARALLWHTELTGVEHPEATALLDVLQSPPGLAEFFRAQVRGLRG